MEAAGLLCSAAHACIGASTSMTGGAHDRHDAAGRFKDRVHKNGVLGTDVDIEIAEPA